MKRSACVWLLAPLFGCAALLGRMGGGTTPEGPQLSPSGERPNWIDQTVFFDDRAAQRNIYAVGSAEIPEAELQGCWPVDGLIGLALRDARGKLVGPLGQELAGRARPSRGWFDGQHTLHLLVELTTPKDADAPIEVRLPPTGGLTPPPLSDFMQRTRAQAVAPICEDPHRRTELSCCGPANRFCSDPTRYSEKAADGTCRCGRANPCLQDFACVEKNGRHRCVCQGPSCPCEILQCKPGQTCEDSRCF